MSRSLGLSALFLAAVAVPLIAAEPVTIIMTDGFVVQGEYAKESDVVYEGGRSIKVAKTDGFDVIMDGPKFVIFSTHAQKGGKIDKEIVREKGIEYTTKVRARALRPVLPIKSVNKIGAYNESWIRVLETTTLDNNPNQKITQQVSKLTPYSMILDSPTDKISQGFHTYEEDPRLIRRLLSLHPELREAKEKPDADKRIRIAQFLNEVGRMDGTRRSLVWHQSARLELESTKKEVLGTWEKKTLDQFDQTMDDIDRAETRFVVDELEAALKSGRYALAKNHLDSYTPKAADPKDRTRMAKVKVEVDSVQPGYEKTIELLRNVVEAESGMRTLQTHAAVAGVGAAVFAPRPMLKPNQAVLVDACSIILGELHPDTASRLELFSDLAKQVEQRLKDGKSPAETPEQLLAYAVSGWVKGKNGADRNVESAVRNWQLRQMAVQYLRESTGNSRKAYLDAFLKANPKPIAPDELTQIITLLPPPVAADVNALPGTAVDPKAALGVDGIRRVNTGPLSEQSKGVDYHYRLPPEYHHGRSYPVLIAVPSRGMPGEHVIARLAEQAERNGYIVIAPDWTNPFSTQIYDYSGKDHVFILGALRDALRRFQGDPDRVFLYGYGEGADMALDVGMSHPDHFAGLSGIGVNPPQELFLEFWRNAQKLPTYFVTGEMSGAFPNLRKLYERWMPRGYPAMLTVYRGRGLEWYSAEIPRLFDWMNRKTRARGTAVLRLNQFSVEPWQIARDGNDRFYWVGVSQGGVRPSNQLANGLKKVVQPLPQFTADIGKGGTINITQSLGIRKFTIWLERDLVDWTKPVRVTVNGNVPIGYTPKVLTPDLHLMLEELHRTADRKLLFLGKIEVDGPG